MGTKFNVGYDYLLVKVGISGDRLKISGNRVCSPFFVLCRISWPLSWSWVHDGSWQFCKANDMEMPLY